MATLESIVYLPHRSFVVDGRVEWKPVNYCKVIEDLPQIIWKDCTPWREANLRALELATSVDANLKTVQSIMNALHAYAQWLEQTGTDWWDFPPKKADRCLVRYRGALIGARDSGEIAPSTASQRMAAVVRFYRWLFASGLVSPDWPMWRERSVGIRLVDPVGFNRTITVNSTDLVIKNRKVPGDRLEDGLLPVSATHREAILDFAKEHASEELFLMLTLGFFTGMRLGTLADLKIQTLERAAPDPASPDLYRLAVGPGADPPVQTKFGVTGHIHITRAHLHGLRDYFYSERRLNRQALAATEHRDLIFLTRFGNPYARRGSNKSPAINVEMHALRTHGTAQGLVVLRHFHFHQTRCTFATELARLAIAACGAINALAIVKDFLLHKHEATAMLYVKFVEKTPAKEEAANSFTREFLGVINGRKGTTHV
jgi:integrase